MFANGQEKHKLNFWRRLDHLMGPRVGNTGVFPLVGVHVGFVFGEGPDQRSESLTYLILLTG